MQYFFFFSRRDCDMHAQRLWRPAASRGQSVPLQDLAGFFSSVEVSYRLSSFNVSLLSLLLLRYLLFFPFSRCSFLVKMKTMAVCCHQHRCFFFNALCHSPRSVHNFLLLQCWAACCFHFSFFFLFWPMFNSRLEKF